MTGLTNRTWNLTRYPQGVPTRDCFTLTETEGAHLKPGQVRVHVVYLSMDPAPRMRMDPVPRMGPPLSLGSVVIGRGAGIVEESAAPGLNPGAFVTGELGWQEHAVVNAADLVSVDCSAVPLTSYLGILASSGLTAYLTLVERGAARAGETVVVSAAAGSVGLAASQIAKILGCRVIGMAHGPEQALFLSTFLGLDAVIDDLDPDFPRALAAASPQSVDVFLDSVGGTLHNAVMERIAVGGRAVLYGFISAYNAAAGTETEYGRVLHVIKRRARVEGFLLGDHAARFPHVISELTQWLNAGELRSFEAITQGFERVPEAFSEIFGQATPGKHLVRIAPDPALVPQHKEK